MSLPNTKLFDSLLEPVFVLNQDTKITYCNEAAAMLCGFNVRRILRSGFTIHELFTFQMPVDALAELATITDSSPYQEVAFTTKEGKQARVQLTVQKFSEDPSWLMYLRDVTLEETLQRKYRTEIEQKELVIEDLRAAQIQLENYSKNLEKMVAERTEELSQINREMKALLDSLNQGFLIFDQEGKCLDVASKACSDTLCTDPRGALIWDVLCIEDKDRKNFKRWMVTVFSEMLPFEDLEPLAPRRFAHPEGKEISLAYFPVRDETGKIQNLVLVASDITNLLAAQRDAEREKAYAKLVIMLVRQRRQLQSFIAEADQLVKAILLQCRKDLPHFEETFRALHTLKGGASNFSAINLVNQAHKTENQLKLWQETSDSLALKTLKNMAYQLPEILSSFVADCGQILGQSLQNLKTTREIPTSELSHFFRRLPEASPLRAEFFTKFILEPIGPLLQHFNETLSQVAAFSGKVVAPLEIEPEDFQLWAEPYENLFSTFVHAIRNAVDHGIEEGGQRELLGKASPGRVGIHVEREGNDLTFKLWDDGQGIDPSKIRKKLDSLSISHTHEDDLQVIQHVFDSEFSTRDEVTEISGRGVGMDAIKQEAFRLGGTISVSSHPGRGSEVLIKVPWIDKPLPDVKSKAS